MESLTVAEIETEKSAVKEIPLKKLNFGLKDLIEMIRKNPKIGNGKIRHPRMLIKYLVKLDGMIGNHSIKKSVAEQICSILKQDRIQGINTNTIIYGPSGVGKSSFCVYLAKIWYAMGCLQGQQIDEVTNQHRNSKNKSNFTGDMGTGGINGLTEAVLWVTILFLLYVILSGIIPPIYNLMGAKWFFITLGILFFIVLISWGVSSISNNNQNDYYYRKKNNTVKNNNDEKQEKYENKVEENKKDENKTNSKNMISLDDIDDIDDDVVIKIAGRGDFVGQYIGHSEFKSKNTILACKGKVLFIDEAYSLLNSSNDPFGIEALNTINQMIGEMKGEITVIMAGYKKDMEKLYEKQSGLLRRFPTIMRCQKYTGEELADIFELQLAKEGYIIKEPKITKSFIACNKHLFKCFGGDTEILCGYSIEKENLYNLQREMENGKYVDKKMISFQSVKEALDDFKTKRGKDEDSDDDEVSNQYEDDFDIKKFMDMFKNRKVSSCE